MRVRPMSVLQSSGRSGLHTSGVDDILVWTELLEIYYPREAFVEQSKWITPEVGEKHSYLGMQMTIRCGAVEIEI
jgi:hypothetical protein